LPGRQSSNMRPISTGRLSVKRVEKSFTSQILDLKDKLDAANDSLEENAVKLKKLKKEAEVKAQKEFEAEKKALQEEIEEKAAAIEKFKEKEIALRKERKQLQEERENLELSTQRKLDEERVKIQKAAADTESERFKYKELEYKKQLDTVTKVNEDLTRKLAQGSQQLQGEVLELELETLLRNSFPHDEIIGVAKGARGADVLQKVRSPAGEPCGTIIWEAKRAQNWTDKWLSKLKDDSLAAHANISVLVTTCLPKECTESFMIIQGVWIVSDGVVRPVAETLRTMLVEISKLKLANSGKKEKMELLYNYLSGAQFAQVIRSVVEAFTSMKLDLAQEKSAMSRIWKKRESQLDRVSEGMCAMVGEIQAIAQESFPELDTIQQLDLPGGTDS
jgi:hypothetical protein